MLTVKAPAKINWSLFVLDKREDGYHNIVSLLQCIGLYDVIEFELSDGLTLESNLDLPFEQNLVYRAAVLLRDYAGIKKGARITLKKEIPSGAGLGGGSSDGAYTLMALNKLWELGLDNGELKLLGNKLGSDVPFFFNGPLALAEGRGERLTSLAVAMSHVLLLVKADCSVSTSWAYGELGRAVRGDIALTKTDNKINNIQFIYGAVAAGDLSSIARNARNDFEDAVIRQYPVIGTVKEQLIKSGAVMALMSGSGSAVFGLFEDENVALNAAGDFPSYFCKVVKTLIS
ncbi:MAG: 4-(cytidine 5'-diphospho)-2-C-methyl-D-erythritol kinase [Nitrospirae bacterium]|nr:4-(cytidine 5'-diphospho)-2-C-methyl-D-erythritol kinase [Nitrospirota bacterium]